MDPLSTPKLVLKRLADSRALVVSILLGIVAATTLAAMAPTFFAALERLALNLEIDELRRPASNVNLDLFNIVLARSEVDGSEQIVVDAIAENIDHVYERHERFLFVDAYLAGIPRNPLPPAGTSNRDASRAVMRSYSNLADHVAPVEGQLAGDQVYNGPVGPVAEAVISEETADQFGLGVGDEVVMTRELGGRRMVTVLITGIVRPIDPSDDYWKPLFSTRVFLDPPSVEEEVEGQDVQFNPEEPPAPLMVTKAALIDSLGAAYPGALVNSMWFIMIDTERLKGWSAGEAEGRIRGLGKEVVAVLPGTKLNSAILGMLDRFGRRSFFARVPLMLLVAILVATVLLYVSMMVSHLVRRREGDAALLQARGVKLLHLLRLYSIEGAVLAVAGVAAGPFMAIAIVALVGTLPYFSEMTHGGLLPVQIGATPFVVSLGAGALCFGIVALSSVLGARGGLLGQKQRMSRPPSEPFFHRYYLDVGLLALGGLAFWELHSRGQLVTGGLLKDVEVNETLLLAPVMFLVMVALVFMRCFPIFVRYVSGESPLLVHLLAAASFGVAVPVVVLADVRAGDPAASAGSVALLVAGGAAYWATQRAGPIWQKVLGMAAQAVALGWFIWMEPPRSGDVLLAPAIGLAALVPAQVLFVLLSRWTRTAPVWLMIAMWHMARNPLQYSWLVLLLVMVTGVAVLSTTVGGTLERGQTERIYYDFGTDLRADLLGPDLRGGPSALRERSLATPGVEDASLAFRTDGFVGSVSMEVLAIESRFAYITWYRGDFSSRPVNELIGDLRPGTAPRALLVPDGASVLGLWVKVDEGMPTAALSLWVVLEDATGALRTLVMGDLIPSAEWTQLRAELPELLSRPARLVSVQISEPGYGAVHTPGFIVVDHIHAEYPDGSVEVIEGFEGPTEWEPILTSALAAEQLKRVEDDPHRGAAAIMFSFGRENIRGIRGFYHQTTEGPLPVIVSSALAETTGIGRGDFVRALIAERGVTVVVRGVADYFPTMSRRDGRFIVADLDALLSRVNILGGLTAPLRPNEMFLAENPSSPEPVRDSIASSGLLRGGLRHRGTELDELQRDPLSSAGWNAMVVLALAVAVLSAAFGYVTYLLLFAAHSRSEMGFLQSLGLSRLQVLALLGFEHLAIAAIGVGLGTWAGFQMSRLIVSPLAVTERGEPLIPPFILTTDWSMMLPAYGALAAIFLVALLAVNRSALHLDLQSISRTEG